MHLYSCIVVLSSYVYLAAASTPTHGNLLDARGQSLNPRLATVPLHSRDLPTGTCDSQTPCANKACCGKDNLCGYSIKSCGTGCQFNCDAKSECGPYALANSQKCPLSVCCSKFGFCGSTTEFCNWTNPDDPVYPACDTKYGGCGDVKRPSCGGNSAAKRTIGYYESWSNTRKCSKVAPEDLNLDGFTHINFAFSFFDPSTFQITPMDANGASLYSRFTGLKSKRPGLQTWVSVGGWSFTDPGPTQQAFSVMTSTQGNRAKFIQGVLQFMNTYSFDGVDLDWEYPGADDRGGNSADSANYVLLAKEMKSAFGSKYGLSMTLPTSFWYLQHFDLPGIQEHVDWFNLMAYDLHGVWDKESKFVGPYVAPHTNISEIDLGLDLLWRAGIRPENVVMGLAWYGRSFKLSDPSCNVPNGVCQFSDGADAGPCSNAAGILDNQEIFDIISTNNLKPVWDKSAGVKWITWSSNQWVSYDDLDTFKQKMEFANSRCLGGTLVWAMDQVDQTASNGLGPAPGVATSDQQSSADQMSADMAAGLTCRTSECGKGCPTGSHEVTETNGQPGSLSTAERCPKGKYQSVCCDAGTTMGKCQWRGYRGAGLSCIGGCADGETEVTTNKNNHDKKKGDQTCNGGVQSYCCAGFKPAPSKKQLEEAAKDAAKEAVEAAAAQAALDIAAKIFCRVAVPALLAPLEIIESFIPIIGEILDIAEIAATPALVQLCVKGIEKEGKAEFKVFGKKHTISMDKPSTKPATRPPTSSHEPPKTSTKDDQCTRGVAKRGVEKRAPNCGLTPVTKWVGQDKYVYDRSARTCTGTKYPQACMHYSSAIRVANNAAFNPVTCSSYKKDRAFAQNGPALAAWSIQHKKPWRSWMRRDQKRCERDEWPPAEFWQGDPGQYIRYNHKEDNGGAGQIWGSFCPNGEAPHRCVPGTEKVEKPAGRRAETTSCQKEVTVKVMSMAFDMEELPLAQLRDDGLSVNECYPQMLVNDPSFALLNNDPYFLRNGRTPDLRFGSDIPANLINGQNPPFRKRDALLIDPNDYSVDNITAASSRRLTEEELEVLAEEFALQEHFRMLDEQLEELGYLECEGDECVTRLHPSVEQSIAYEAAAATAPSPIEATATASIEVVQTQGSVPLSRSGPTLPPAPQFTGEFQHEDLKLMRG